MTRSLEINALLNGIESLWQRAEQPFDQSLFTIPRLDEADGARLGLAKRLASGDRQISLEVGRQAKPLQTIFGCIKVEDSAKPNKPNPAAMYLPVQSEQVTSRVVPQSNIADATAKNGYRGICEALTPAAQQLKVFAGNNEEAYLEGLFWLLRKHLVNVPYSPALPDVSLFDFNHSVAAIATVLRNFSDEQVQALIAAPFAEQQPMFAALVGGDVSGVQDFIYDIRAQKAAKSLRGRSLYLQLFTDAAARYVLRQLDLPITSLLYGGGAHFFLLAPAEVAEKNLRDIQKDLTQLILAAHGQTLYLALAGAPVAPQDLQAGNISARWTDLHKQLRHWKNNRYTELDAEQMQRAVFAPHPPRDNSEEKKENYDPCESRDPLTRLYCQLGQAFPRADYLLYGIGTPDLAQTRNPLDALGLHVAFDPSWRIKQMPDNLSYVVRLALSDAPDRPTPVEGALVIEGTRYMVKLVSEDVQFGDLAARPVFNDENGKPHGIKRLGILRMDVDGLGSIFQKGLGQFSTLSRITTLSRTISVFFEGHVTGICQDTLKALNLVYAVYAGGDDVFLVGAWHVMPQLARAIHDAFAEYTGKHPNFHVSAGIAVVTDKYPLYRAAEQAGEALDSGAKRHPGKDAISFMDEVCSFAAFAEVEKWAKRLIDFGQEHASTALMGVIRRLISLELTRRATTRIATERKPKGKVAEYGRWIWTGEYQLNRLHLAYQKSSRPDDQALAQLINEIKTVLQGNKYENLQTIAFAARWAHLALRRSQE